MIVFTIIYEAFMKMFTASARKICQNISMEIQAHCFLCRGGCFYLFYRLFLEFGEAFGWFYSKSCCHVNTSNFSETKMCVWF